MAPGKRSSLWHERLESPANIGKNLGMAGAVHVHEHVNVYVNVVVNVDVLVNVDGSFMPEFFPGEQDFTA